MKKIVIKIKKDVDIQYINDFIKTVLDVGVIKEKLNGKFESNNFSIRVK